MEPLPQRMGADQLGQAGRASQRGDPTPARRRRDPRAPRPRARRGGARPRARTDGRAHRRGVVRGSGATADTKCSTAVRWSPRREALRPSCTSCSSRVASTPSASTARTYPEPVRTTASRPEQPPELGDLRLKRVRRLRRLVVAPQLVDEPIVGHGARCGEREQREQGLELGAGDRNRSRTDIDLGRAEQRDQERRHIEPTDDIIARRWRVAVPVAPRSGGTSATPQTPSRTVRACP